MQIFQRLQIFSCVHNFNQGLDIILNENRSSEVVFDQQWVLSRDTGYIDNCRNTPVCFDGICPDDGSMWRYMAT